MPIRAIVARPPVQDPATFDHMLMLGNSSSQSDVPVKVNCFLQALTPPDESICGSSDGWQLSSANFGQLRHSDSVVEDVSSLLLYYLTIRGAATITVSDDANNSLTLYPVRQITGNGLPSVTSYILAPGNAKLVLPTDHSLTIKFQSGSGGMGLDLALADDITTQAIRYRDLALPPGVMAMLRITTNGVETLKYDSDGDGIFETTVTPTSSVTGTAAQDIEPPSVSIGSSAQGSNALVTISASDVGSGVKAISYSLNGINFLPYTNPFIANPNQNPVVYAFADDNVANRSGLVSYIIHVSVSGRILTPDGRGLRNAAVSLTDSNNVRRTVTTSSFGYYSFDAVQNGANYTISVSSRLYRFAPRHVLVNNNLTDVDFVGLE